MVHDAGQGAGSNVRVTVALPPGATTGPLTGTGCSGAGPVTCTLASLASGVSAGFQFGIVFTGAGLKTVSCSVTADTPDLNPSNNIASATINVTAPPLPTDV